MDKNAVQKLTVLVLVALTTLIFGIMIKGYFVTLLLAGLFSGLARPVYIRILNRTKEKRSLATGATLLIVLLIVIIPFGVVLSIVVVQAVQVGQSTGPWIQEALSRPDLILSRLKDLPFYDYLAAYQDDILVKLGELVSSLSSLLVNSITQLTSSTIHAGFLFFIFLYSMFFFMRDGEKLINTILYYLPLDDENERVLLAHFTSVTGATLRGTLLIGLIQGTLAAAGFWVAGINSVVFWGLMMTVLSIIPVIGSSLIWIPAVIILGASGQIIKAVVLGIYCAVIVGSIDNILRPMLIGKDTRMHEMLILLGTLGGIGMFGIWGFIIGPVIAALFVSIWDLFGETFKSYLPAGDKGEEKSDADGDSDDENDESAEIPEGDSL